MPPNVLSNIPIKLIREQIKAFEQESQEHLSIDDIKQRIGSLMQGYTAMTSHITSPLAWRARRNTGNGDFRHVQSLWYPPPECITTYGRLNRPGYPIMYLAANHQTAVLELRPTVGDKFTVLQIRLKDCNTHPHVMELGVVEKASQFNIPSAVRLPENTTDGMEFLQHNTEKNHAIRSFLAQEFTRVVPRGQEHQFKVSAAISEMLMNSSKVDGIRYPCMAGPQDAYKGGENMALKAEAADRLYIADTCWVAEVTDRVTSPVEGFVLKCVKHAQRIEPNGVINW